jgi:hypothetical protein
LCVVVILGRSLNVASKTVTLGDDLAVAGTGTLTLGNTAILGVPAGIELDVGGGTFTTTGAGLQFPAGTVFTGSTDTIALTNTLTIDATGAVFTVGTGGVLVGDVELDGGTNTVTITDATITATDDVTFTQSSATVDLADTAIITLDGGGIIEVAGTTGGITLPNTKFGTGTYTASGELIITAGSSGDTIATDGTTDGYGLTIGSSTTAIVLKENGTTAATFTLTKSNSGVVTFSAANGNGAIVIPAGTSTGGELKASGAGVIEIGSTNTTGGITLTGGTAKGQIYLVQGAKLGTASSNFAASSSTGTTNLSDFTATVVSSNDVKIVPTSATYTIISTSDFNDTP